MTGRWLKVVAQVFVLALCGSAAFAKQPSAEELAVARELFEKAQAAETDEDWVMCEEHVSEAIAIIETPGLRFHLAYCKEQQGRWVEALVDYKRAKELVASGVKAPDVAELLGPAIRRLETELPKLTLLMDEVPDGTELYLDGDERSPRLIGRPIPVDPGGRRISVSAPGYHPFAQHVNLLSKERRVLRIRLAEKASGGASQTDAAQGDGAVQQDIESPGKGTSARTWVLIAEGALALGGAGLAAFYHTEHSTLQGNQQTLLADIPTGACVGDPASQHPNCPGLAEVNEDLDNANKLRIAGYVTAGVGLTALVTTLLVWDADSEETATFSGSGRAGLPKAKPARLLVGGGPSGVYGMVRGSF